MNSIDIVRNHNDHYYGFIDGLYSGYGIHLTPKEEEKLTDILDHYRIRYDYIILTLFNTPNMPYHVNILGGGIVTNFGYNDPWLKDFVQNVWYNFIQAQPIRSPGV